MDHHGATGPSVPARWWGPTTTVANADVMNQLCRVCGEPAAGFHFGAFTCEGCKSFFGRTYNNLSSVSECKNNGECIINKKNRTSCKACRLRKCLLVGMSKSGSRYGRRSNWFKIHCLLQEQQLQQQHHHQQQIQQTHLGGGLQTKSPSWDYAKSAALLDIDNNNTPSETKSESPPPFAASHALAKAPDSSSFWSSRPSPLTVPHQHSLPYFISPFLQNPLQPIAHNYLLPFLPIRAPLPLEPLVIPSPPSSPRSSPTSAVTPTQEPAPDEADRSLEKLRSLGPEQEQPIDLSAAKTKDRETQCRRESRCHAEVVSRCEGRGCEGDKRDDKRESSAKCTTPLDLRRSKP